MKYAFIIIATTLITISHHNQLLPANPNQKPNQPNRLAKMAVTYDWDLEDGAYSSKKSAAIIANQRGVKGNLTLKQWQLIESHMFAPNSPQAKTLSKRDALRAKLKKKEQSAEKKGQNQK